MTRVRGAAKGVRQVSPLSDSLQQSTDATDASDGAPASAPSSTAWQPRSASTRASTFRIPTDQPLAPQRLAAFEKLLVDVSQLPVVQQVAEVNNFFNYALTYTSDSERPGGKAEPGTTVDTWSSPGSSLNDGVGDCEDFAIAKYYALRSLGVPQNQLHLAWVTVPAGTAHMVALYSPREGEPLVLDLGSPLKPLSQASNYTLRLLINGAGVKPSANTLADVPAATVDKWVKSATAKWNPIQAQAKREGFPE